MVVSKLYDIQFLIIEKSRLKGLLPHLKHNLKARVDFYLFNLIIYIGVSWVAAPGALFERCNA